MPAERKPKHEYKRRIKAGKVQICGEVHIYRYKRHWWIGCKKGVVKLTASRPEA